MKWKNGWLNGWGQYMSCTKRYEWFAPSKAFTQALAIKQDNVLSTNDFMSNADIIVCHAYMQEKMLFLVMIFGKLG